MDVQRISREYTFSDSNPALLTKRQDPSAFQFNFPAGTNSRPVSTRHNNRTTVVEEQSYPQPLHRLWTLPQKRSNQSLASGRVGDPEGSHPRVFSGNYSAKRFKGPNTPPIPSPCSNVVTISRPLLDLSEAKTVSSQQADPAEATGNQLEFDRPKTLQSPFEYTQGLINSGQPDPTANNENANNENQRFNPNRPMRSKNSSAYIYYASTNPSDKTNQTFDAHRRVPRRQLSYGDPPRNPGPRILHKSTGSWELRHDAERDAVDYDLDSWSDSTSNGSAARPYHSEPMRSKRRLWLDLSEEKDKIQEAHAITIRTSPSRPQVISTPCRRATINLIKKTTPVCPDQVLSNPYPHTPPPTPASSEPVVGLGIESIVDRKYDEAYERIKAKRMWTQTPPSSNPSSTRTVRRAPPEWTPPARADTPRPTAPVQPQLSGTTLWIITELETLIASIPQVNLQLDSPVIRQICLPAGQRRVPVKKPPTLPLSRYSNFKGPLSSHPTHSSSKFPLQAAPPRASPFPPTNRPLDIIFPHASSQLLSSLQATYLALHYVSTIHPPSPPSSSSSSPSIEIHSALSLNMSYIPAKARATLGMQTPTYRPGLPASWTWPETRGWRERIEDLKCKLRSEVVNLIGMCEGSDLGENEALVRAVGQVVRIGQWDEHRAN